MLYTAATEAEEQEQLRLIVELRATHEPLAERASDLLHVLWARCKLLEARLTLAENALERRQTTVQGLKGV